MAKSEFESLSPEALYVSSSTPACPFTKDAGKIPRVWGSESYKMKLKERLSWENQDQIKINHEL